MGQGTGIAKCLSEFLTYKMLEGKQTWIDGWGDSEEARQLLMRCTADD